jgi:hypothetical protein
MKDRVVANSAAVTDREWKARVSMESTVILDVGPLANFNPFIVTAKHRTKPNASANFYPHLANDDSRICYITMIGRCHVRFLPTQTIERHSILHRQEV